jgi:hypothetical protein
MSNEFYQKILRTFHQWEMEDFNAVCSIVNKRKWKDNVVIISDSPYLSLLIFTALIRYFGICIHILNPAEGVKELTRLVHFINPDFIVLTDSYLEDELTQYGYKIYLVNGDTISNEEEDETESPTNLDFTVVTYSPSPTKVYKITGEKFSLMANSISEDLHSSGLVSGNDTGLIPITTDNCDYLLYFIALKLSCYYENNPMRLTLPDANDCDLVLRNRKSFLMHNTSRTLIVPKKELVRLWSEKISTIFENKFMFKLHLKHKWLVNMIIKYRLKKLFKGFKRVLILGELENAYMIDTLKNVPYIKFYSVFTIPEEMMFGAISNSLDYIIPTTNSYRMLSPVTLSDNTKFKGKPITILSYKLLSNEFEKTYNVTDYRSRYVENTNVNDNLVHEKKFYRLGNIENSFDREKSFIFPETLERVINSYPFVRNCVLLTFKNKTVLVLHPNMDILDSIRVNYKMFSDIISKQIKMLNKELPESYKIQDFVISTELIELDRDGEIVRYPFQYCQQK